MVSLLFISRLTIFLLKKMRRNQVGIKNNYYLCGVKQKRQKEKRFEKSAEKFYK